MIKIAIVEDNEEELNGLRMHLEQYGRESGRAFSIDTYKDGDEIAEGFRRGYDLIFMDIELPLLDGMEAAELIRKEDRDVTLIFITNNPNYAIRGYKVNALDYILKPASYETVFQVTERALLHRGDQKKKFITVRVRNGAVKVEVSKIRYIDVLDHYICYHTTEGGITTKASMKDAAAELSEEPFFQCNKAYLVNLAYVDGIEGNDLLIGGEKIPVSRSRKKAFWEAMNEFMMQE